MCGISCGGLLVAAPLNHILSMECLCLASWRQFLSGIRQTMGKVIVVIFMFI